MATKTILEIVNLVKTTRSFGGMTSTVGLAWAQLVASDIYSNNEMLEATPHGSPVNINLTSGTKEYAIDERFVQITDVQYRTGASAGTTLTATTMDAIRIVNPDWRKQASGAPEYYYISSNAGVNIIGLHPTPNSSTSGGYPVLQLWGAQKPATLTLSTEIGNTVRSPEIYIYGISLHAAYQFAPEAVDHLRALYELEKRKNIEWLETRNNIIKGGEVLGARR